MNMKQSLVNNQTKHNNIRLSLNYRVKNTPEINSAISLSRILGMVFIVLCHIIKYYEFVPMHESLAQFFNLSLTWGTLYICQHLIFYYFANPIYVL